MTVDFFSPEARTSALTAFGYSSAEASFLALAALHGGYFLRRQAAQFLGTRDGGRVTQLVQRALALEHAQCSVWRQNVHLYHLSARPLYAALGEPDNRNRRRHEWTQIKSRVMRLDFVLAHPDAQFLATEREKTSYFSALGVPAKRFPAKRFRSESDPSGTARCFIDKYPIRVMPATGSELGEVEFGFVDEGSVGLSRLEAHLTLYRPLFEALPKFGLVYVAASSTHFARAATTFDWFSKQSESANGQLVASSTDELLTYFRLRQRYQQRELAAFDRSDLIRLRDARERFADAKHEALFRLWQTAGDAVLTQNQAPKEAGTGPLRGTFRTELLRHDYAFFGDYGLR